MKNKFLVILLFIFIGLKESSFSQITPISTTPLIGTWKMNNHTPKIPVPEVLVFDTLDKSLILIPHKNDTNHFTKIIKYDSSKITLKNVFFDQKSKKYNLCNCNLILDSTTGKLYGNFKMDNNSNYIKLEYSFETECCSNHHPMNCADTPQELQNLKMAGCTGFHRPK